jgi:hypothetical protein
MAATAYNQADLRTEGERLHTFIFGSPITEPILEK